jgi:hypothetical protein
VKGSSQRNREASVSDSRVKLEVFPIQDFSGKHKYRAANPTYYCKCD